MSRMAQVALAAVAGGAAALTVASAGAETLADAIALAYRSNPTLQAQRAQLRALDETIVTARAGYRPTASVSASLGYSDSQYGGGAGHIEANSGNATLTLSQPLYTGGRATAAVRAAEANVDAGREGLRATEAQVLQQVIQAYADVRRDQQIVAIRRNNVQVLTNQLEETRAKFEVGQITRTDVAQAEAQLASARALLSSSQAELEISRASYLAVVGQPAGELAPEPPPDAPATIDEAFDIAEAESPTVRQARATETASRARIAEARAAGRPTVSLQGTLGYAGALSPFSPGDYNRAVTAEAVVTQPLFTGGVTASNIRSASEQNTADRINVEAARRQAVLVLSQAWSAMSAARANVVSDEAQVKAATIAFEGSLEEYRVGLRTTLDVLIAQQTLRDAELALVQARHDAFVDQTAVLAAMGRLEARYLVKAVELYDPARSTQKRIAAGATPWDFAVAAIDRAGAPEEAKSAAMQTRPVSGEHR